MISVNGMLNRAGSTNWNILYDVQDVIVPEDATAELVGSGEVIAAPDDELVVTCPFVGLLTVELDAVLNDELELPG